MRVTLVFVQWKVAIIVFSHIFFANIKLGLYPLKFGGSYKNSGEGTSMHVEMRYAT